MDFGKLWSDYKRLQVDTAVSIAEKQEYKPVTVEVIAGNTLIQRGKVTISKGNKPQELIFKTGAFSKTPAIVHGIAWEFREERDIGKAAAGAIAGGLLTGGLGAVAGAVVGGRKQDASIAVLSVEGGNGLVYVRCNAQEYEALQQLIYGGDSAVLQALKNKRG